MHILYRFFDSGESLLYVGITKNPPARLAGHQSDKEWWSEVRSITMEHHGGRDELKLAERDAIRAEKPKYNVVYNGSPKKRKRTPKAPILYWDRTDAGFAFIAVFCPYCKFQHRHPLAETNPGRSYKRAGCDQGWYSIFERPNVPLLHPDHPRFCEVNRHLLRQQLETVP